MHHVDIHEKAEGTRFSGRRALDGLGNNSEASVAKVKGMMMSEGGGQ